jgi:hypothetical protein
LSESANPEILKLTGAHVLIHSYPDPCPFSSFQSFASVPLNPCPSFSLPPTIAFLQSVQDVLYNMYLYSDPLPSLPILVCKTYVCCACVEAPQFVMYLAQARASGPPQCHNTPRYVSPSPPLLCAYCAGDQASKSVLYCKRPTLFAFVISAPIPPLQLIIARMATLLSSLLVNLLSV